MKKLLVLALVVVMVFTLAAATLASALNVKTEMDWENFEISIASRSFWNDGQITFEPKVQGNLYFRLVADLGDGMTAGSDWYLDPEMTRTDSGGDDYIAPFAIDSGAWIKFDRDTLVIDAKTAIGDYKFDYEMCASEELGHVYEVPVGPGFEVTYTGIEDLKLFGAMNATDEALTEGDTNRRNDTFNFAYNATYSFSPFEVGLGYTIVNSDPHEAAVGDPATVMSIRGAANNLISGLKMRVESVTATAGDSVGVDVDWDGVSDDGSAMLIGANYKAKKFSVNGYFLNQDTFISLNGDDDSIIPYGSSTDDNWLLYGLYAAATFRMDGGTGSALSVDGKYNLTDKLSLNAVVDSISGDYADALDPALATSYRVGAEYVATDKTKYRFHYASWGMSQIKAQVIHTLSGALAASFFISVDDADVLDTTNDSTTIYKFTLALSE